MVLWWASAMTHLPHLQFANCGSTATTAVDRYIYTSVLVRDYLEFRFQPPTRHYTTVSLAEHKTRATLWETNCVTSIIPMEMPGAMTVISFESSSKPSNGGTMRFRVGCREKGRLLLIGENYKVMKRQAKSDNDIRVSLFADGVYLPYKWIVFFPNFRTLQQSHCSIWMKCICTSTVTLTSESNHKLWQY